MTRIDTEHLVKLVGTLLHTSGGLGAASGLLLHTTRGYFGEEVGVTDLLVGTSTNGAAVGHTYVPCYGQMPAAMLWPAADAAAVVNAFKPKLKTNKDHVVEISREGTTVTVADDPDLFGDGLKVKFSQGELDNYPRQLFGLLRDTPLLLDDWGPSLPRTDFSPDALEPFIKVAKARKEKIRMFRYHQRGRQLVQIGPHYTGCLASAQEWDAATEGQAPDSDVYVPDLPEPAAD